MRTTSSGIVQSSASFCYSAGGPGTIAATGTTVMRTHDTHKNLCIMYTPFCSNHVWFCVLFSPHNSVDYVQAPSHVSYFLDDVKSLRTSTRTSVLGFDVPPNEKPRRPPFQHVYIFDVFFFYVPTAAESGGSFPASRARYFVPTPPDGRISQSNNENFFEMHTYERPMTEKQLWWVGLGWVGLVLLGWVGLG